MVKYCKSLHNFHIISKKFCKSCEFLQNCKVCHISNLKKLFLNAKIVQNLKNFAKFTNFFLKISAVFHLQKTSQNLKDLTRNCAKFALFFRKFWTNYTKFSKFCNNCWKITKKCWNFGKLCNSFWKNFQFMKDFDVFSRWSWLQINMKQIFKIIVSKLLFFLYFETKKIFLHLQETIP